MDRYLAFSPLRITFAGGGTDVEPFIERYGGAVLNSTIDRKVMVTYEPDPYDLELSSRDFLKSITLVSESNDVLSKLYKLFESKGVSRGRVIINNAVPPGSGLGSSSALITAILKLIYSIKGKEISANELAAESYRLEKDYFNIALGKQDPYAISMGHFKLMEFTRDSENMLDLSEYSDFIQELEKRTLLIYTGSTRESSTFLKSQIDQTENKNSKIIPKLLEIKSIAYKMVDAVKTNDLNAFISDLNRGWEIKKELDKNISNKKIDNLIEEAKNNHAQGIRLMGGGGEGFLLAISEKGKLQELQKSMSEFSDFAIRISFRKNGTTSYKI
ncbi:MAG: kinase [Thermoplasmatales archaeon]|nr:kinase [Thermoplasmatales archaeon]MCW6170058.1 kinase [Thermoplasmatales archaeon]